MLYAAKYGKRVKVGRTTRPLHLRIREHEHVCRVKGVVLGTRTGAATEERNVLRRLWQWKERKNLDNDERYRDCLELRFMLGWCGFVAERHMLQNTAK